jgi:hypothetical protein
MIDHIGEDPARWLDRDLVGGDPGGGMDPRAWLAVRVDGIDELAVVRAWQAVERRLAKRDGREPRQAVLDLLDDREAALREQGERWDRPETDPGSVPSRDARVDERSAADYRELAEESPIGVGGKAREVWGSPAEQLAERREQAADGDADEGDASPLADEFEDFADELAAEADGSVDRGTRVGPTLPDGGERE